MMLRLIVIVAFGLFNLIPCVGCSRNLRKELSRGTSPQLPSALSRDLAHQAPVNAPQPPMPPPLPGEPILAPPQSNAITGNIPVLPNGGPAVPMTCMGSYRGSLEGKLSALLYSWRRIPPPAL